MHNENSKQCICIKKHSKMFNTKKIDFYANDVHDYFNVFANKYYVYKHSLNLVDGFAIFTYTLKQFNNYFATDIKDIRKQKLLKLKSKMNQ